MNCVAPLTPPPTFDVETVPGSMELFWKSAALICFSFLWAAVSILVSHFLQLRRHHKNMLLPPGSLGWPYIGETLKMYRENPNSFFSSRQKRYGDVFKTHILGCPCVMTSSPEAAKLILVSQAHKFKPTYPASKEKLIGSEALFFHEGPYHSKLKKMVRASFQPSALKQMVSEIESIVVATLPTWKNRNINTLHEMKKYAFEVALKAAFGQKEMRELDGFKELYHTLEKGYNCMPLNLPGTLFHKATKARKELSETLKRVIEHRRRNGHEDVGGLLTKLMEAGDDTNDLLTDSQIADNIIGIIFAAHDTTASALTWVLKFLHDHQEILNLVTKEQDEIRKILKEENRGLTWDDTLHDLHHQGDPRNIKSSEHNLFHVQRSSGRCGI